MKPAPFGYEVARDLDHALELFGAADGEAKYIAGGQTLGPMLNLRLSQPDLVVDVGRIPALQGAEAEPGRIIFGAGVRHSQIEDGAVPDPSTGLMPKAAAQLAYRAVRNRGTLGGSLAHADPAAEWPNILLALDADVRLHGLDGAREMPIAAFQLGYLTTALGPDEILAAVAVPTPGSDMRWGYRKLCRQPGEFAQSIAITVIPGAGAARCVLGCAGPVPLLLNGVSELSARMRGWTDGAEAEIGAAFDADLTGAGIAVDPLDRRMHLANVCRSIRDALA